jgi:hypothetical protein
VPWVNYNVDETALLYCLVPTGGLALYQMPGVNLEKICVTYMICANTDGSDKRALLIIGKAKQPRCFEKRPAHEMDFYYF